MFTCKPIIWSCIIECYITGCVLLRSSVSRCRICYVKCEGLYAWHLHLQTHGHMAHSCVMCMRDVTGNRPVTINDLIIMLKGIEEFTPVTSQKYDNHLGHGQYILWATDLDRGSFLLSEEKKNRKK